MGTPFIALQEPAKLDSWIRGKPHNEQPSHIPPVLRDAMEVREAVFVREQGVPLEYELDADDPRSCHWVVYASVNQTTEPEQRDLSTGEVVRPRRSVTRSQPVGTLRVVPFPHPPHPRDGGWYVDNVLQQERPAASSSSPSSSSSLPLDTNTTTTTTTTTTAPPPPPSSSTADEGGDNNTNNASAQGATTLTLTESQSAAEEERQTSALPFGPDRATTYHDGREPYVKIGRMAVIPEFRGHRISGQLWRAARAWLEAHPTYFDPSVTELGMDQLKAGAPSEIPKWGGLIVCHAQESVIKVYERWGFKVDEGMGKWYEEGIPHVGMALRLNINKKTKTTV